MKPRALKNLFYFALLCILFASITIIRLCIELLKLKG